MTKWHEYTNKHTVLARKAEQGETIITAQGVAYPTSSDLVVRRSDGETIVDAETFGEDWEDQGEWEDENDTSTDQPELPTSEDPPAPDHPDTEPTTDPTVPVIPPDAEPANPVIEPTSDPDTVNVDGEETSVEDAPVPDETPAPEPESDPNAPAPVDGAEVVPPTEAAPVETPTPEQEQEASAALTATPPSDVPEP